MSDPGHVILVNEKDEAIGREEKLTAHRQGLLHRAVSVFIFNSSHKMLLQQRASGKYHSAGLWTNTCCTHPFPGESTRDSAVRRLKEEMGLDVQDLRFLFSFVYKADLNNGLIEHEFDHVFAGFSDDLPVLNPDEAESHRYCSIDEIRSELQAHPENFSYWFREIFERVAASVTNT